MPVVCQAVGFFQQIEPLLQRLCHPVPNWDFERDDVFTPLQRRLRLLSCRRSHIAVTRQDVGDEVADLLGGSRSGAIETLADMDELQLSDEVVLVVLRLEEEPRRHVLKPHGLHRPEATDVTITVREMRPDEAGAVSSLLLEANGEHLEHFPDPVAEGYRRELAGLATQLPASAVLVATTVGAIVGTVALVEDAEDDAHPWPPGGSILRVLAVAPAARGGGVGRLLTTACLDRARAIGSSYVGLHTSPFMVEARSLYERVGFVRAPEHDFDPAVHYGDGAKSSEPWGLAYVLELLGDRNA